MAWSYWVKIFVITVSLLNACMCTTINSLGQAKLIHSLSSLPACVFRNKAKFRIHYSSLNNHVPDSVYV